MNDQMYAQAVEAQLMRENPDMILEMILIAGMPPYNSRGHGSFASGEHRAWQMAVWNHLRDRYGWKEGRKYAKCMNTAITIIERRMWDESESARRKVSD